MLMTTGDIVGMVVIGLAVIGGLAKMIKDWDVIKECFTKMREKRRVKFAKKQQPYCARICQAPTLMEEVRGKLDKIFDFIEITREISLENHAMAIIDKCSKFIAMGYAPQHIKDDIIHSFVPYVIGDGNGKVFNYVQMLMNLPTDEGGNPCDVNLDEIIKREIDKYEKREEAIRQRK